MDDLMQERSGGEFMIIVEDDYRRDFKPSIEGLEIPPCEGRKGQHAFRRQGRELITSSGEFSGRRFLCSYFKVVEEASGIFIPFIQSVPEAWELAIFQIACRKSRLSRPWRAADPEDRALAARIHQAEEACARDDVR